MQSRTDQRRLHPRGGGFPRVAALMALAMLASQDARASDQASAARPKVGVVLGGGSARGVAHVGVLLWLEEHHIPVDRIAGNSTGALMGSAYATGLSAEGIKHLLLAADWDKVLRPDIPYPLRSFRRKEDDREYAIKLEAGLLHGFRLQSGLNPGHHLGEWISRILLPYSNLTSFDDLPIPFRCVATDLEKGEVVAFDHGPLAPAVRASMSLPGTYDPVRLDGRLLADGGILNNIPVDVAKAMGADIVIAVRTGPKAEEEVAETIAGVANRSITLMMQTLERPRLRQADVVIVPDLDGLTAADFRKIDELAARGYQAAEAQKAALLPYALDDASWAQYRASIEARKNPEKAPLGFVEVKGVSGRAGAQLAAQLSRHLGKPPNPMEIERDLDRIIGLGRYASATYGRVDAQETTGLGVQIRDKSYGPPFVKFSMDVNNENKDINLSLGSRVTMMDVTGPGSEWRFDASLGSTLSFGTELYQPLGGDKPLRGGFFVSPRAAYARISENLYADDKLVAIYGRQRAGGGLGLGWNSGGSTRLRFGYDIAYVRSVSRVGDPQLPSSTGREQALRGRFDYDGQNAAYFPSNGVRLSSTALWFLEAPDAPQRFGAVEGKLHAARSVGGDSILTLTTDGGATFGGPPPTLYQFGLGGPFKLGAYPPGSLRGPRYLLGSLDYKVRVGRLPKLLGSELYLDMLAEAGSVFDQISDARIKTSFTAGLAVDTFLGPLFAGASVGQGRSVRVYFVMGQGVR